MRVDLPGLGAVTRAVSPFLIVNPYGLFAVMTTTRPEIVIEGSADEKSGANMFSATSPGRYQSTAMEQTALSRASTGRCGSPRSAASETIHGSSVSWNVCSKEARPCSACSIPIHLPAASPNTCGRNSTTIVLPMSVPML